MGIDISKISLPQTATEKKSALLFAFLQKDIKLSGNSWNDKKKERFYNGLHVLLTAGIDIRTALELLEQESEKKDEKIIAGQILRAIVDGQTLPEAINASGKFSAYEFYSLRIGEESGRMEEVLKDLAEYYAQKIKQQRKVKSALSYPVVVISVAFGAVFFMMRFVVPMFADMLRRFHTERSEEHTSELQSRLHLVCRLL